ncbi:cytochrome b [Rhodobium orientis]|uniref:Cytochrome B n=2 Tax=Rhodobium orientis TaxID=34017 RepID=A0A327JT13_9HYPH|nr:cytochrome b [Rhodobium orientis]MBK5950732.1 cytochrome b [Rhodobium orientis]RAI29639.1 cytochrome B [Rhodobium orientis]
MLRNTTSGYGLVAIALHWLIAAMIVAMIVVGMYMSGLELTDPNKFQLYQLHKSFGLTLLGLVVVRLLWRFANPAPRLPATLPDWQKAGAHLTHLALYLLLIAMPLSGWLMVSASTLGIPTLYFNLFQVPHLPVPGFLGEPAVAEATLKEVHEALAYLLIVVVVLHIAAALKHHFVDRDDILTRMVSTGPGRYGIR